jgi:hypothetical protein
MTGGGQSLTQLRVPDKTNEIICFAALLEPVDLTGTTVTADALHIQRDHARFLDCEDRQVAVGDRKPTSLCTRHRLPRGRLQDPYRTRPGELGRPP